MTKSVSFSEKNEVRHIEHVDDLSDEEVSTRWYTADDYLLFRSSDKFIIRCMLLGTASACDWCARGLEYRTPDGLMQRRKITYECVDAVLAEQKRQIKSGQADLDRIAAIYSYVGSGSKIQAIKRGESDSNWDEKQIKFEGNGDMNGKCTTHSGKALHKNDLLSKNINGTDSWVQRFIFRSSRRT
jgi:hypothetical protein